MKRFNTTGTCFPDEHYMVDITERLETIKSMILRNDYFCINRGRQYGKTTTLNAIETRFSDEFLIFSMSFEGMSESDFSSLESLCASFVQQLCTFVEFDAIKGLPDSIGALITEAANNYEEAMPAEKFKLLISKICKSSPKPVVLLIDEVDQASNYQSFLLFLGLLRNMYLNRNKVPTFKSVILAGVYNIKNLKLKIRDDNEHQYNSPWNIAVEYNEDMSLSVEGISKMLSEYKADRNLIFNEQEIAQMVYDYSSGYPFLVSRLCQIIDEQHLAWDKNGVLKSVNTILKGENTLFDDLIKKLTQFPDLKETIKQILYVGAKRSFSADEHNTQLARRFNFLAEKDGYIRIACRLMETRLYNLFLSEAENERMYTSGQSDKSQFIHDGYIDMRHLLERFCVHFNDIFRRDDGGMDTEFIEKQGRKQFLLYLRPIINGIGNYYIEAETRDESRTDVIVDYLGQQYVIELKIWHGNAYNERGEKQLKQYLDLYHQKKGYMVSFCFNKGKQPGVHTVQVGDCELIEAVV